jgi:hydrogenase maturation factor
VADEDSIVLVQNVRALSDLLGVDAEELIRG